MVPVSFPRNKTQRFNAAAAGRNAPPRRGNTLFRATGYAVDYLVFAGRTLKPGKTLVEIEEEFDKQNSLTDAAARANTAAASK